jgi:hypothetical protein
MTRSVRCGMILLVGALGACAEDPASPTSPALLTARAAATSGDMPVTAIVADNDATIAPALQIRSDGLGPYRNGSTLTSVIQGIGAWVLDSYNPRNATRRVYLEFSQPVAGSGPNGGSPVAVPSAAYLVRAISKCNLLGTAFQALAPGASMLCPLHVRFDYAGSSYAVQMNPGASAGDPDGNAPESNYATVTCVYPASGTGPCTQWTITPSGMGNRNVAKLLKYVTSKGSTTAVNQGDFYFAFSIRSTNP